MRLLKIEFVSVDDVHVVMLRVFLLRIFISPSYVGVQCDSLSGLWNKFKVWGYK